MLQLWHLKWKCNKRQPQSTRNASTRQPPGHEKHETASLGLYTINGKSVQPFVVDLKLNGKPLHMEVDTGATVSSISEKTFYQLFPGVTLQPTTTQLHSYSGDSISVTGQMEMEVIYDV